METASLLVHAAWAYGTIGFVVAAGFLLFGIDRTDASARGAVAFRPLLLPGIVLLWPMVVRRWLTLARVRQ